MRLTAGSQLVEWFCIVENKKLAGGRSGACKRELFEVATEQSHE